MIILKRVYERSSATDGMRILIERLWPRGVSKERARIDLWLKEAAPSVELREWFGHDPTKWKEFQKRYRAELRQKRETVNLLKQQSREGTVTLVYATRDEEHCSALVLEGFLDRCR